MYDRNTRKGKQDRIKKLEKLIVKVANRTLELEDEEEIIKYLSDVKLDLENQLFSWKDIKF